MIYLLIYLAMSGVAFAQAPAIDELVAKARAQVVEFQQAFVLVSFDERYVQRADGELSGVLRGEVRTNLTSAYVIARSADGTGWTPFRDVLRVNGYRVHDRDKRLTDLFEKPSPTTAAQARRIMDESSRYNIGTVLRTINIPVLAILFLLPEHDARFAFEDGGTDRVGRETARVITFEERQYPTLVRTNHGLDQPSSGRFWIDPATGRVLKTEHITEGAEIEATIATTYRWDEKLSMMVPARMDEEYRGYFATGRIRGTATYSNYRRFSVATDEQIVKPPGG
ncbi:MAG: hypothetical protein Q8L86_13220 [Vicinamibacterales bacterium]|nr:hypothetical protein [Vicinamibacterales bacterium]